MTGVGIWGGMIGSVTIAAVLYMAEHGYAWWQMLLMALLGLCLSPQYRRVPSGERGAES